MIELTEYDPSTGRIMCTHQGVGIKASGQYPVVEGCGDPRTQYVCSGKLAPRPVMPVQYMNGCLFNVPAEADVVIDDNSYRADGTVIHLEFPYPGTYRVRIELWPYQSWRTEITV